ncbi:MAG: hypothetical protein QXV17_12005 [Candidatus Micrarchaeaceae archaeon]
MVGLQGHVVNQSGQALAGITVNAKVYPPIGSPYNLTPETTDSNGNVYWTNVEAYSKFVLTTVANSEYTSATGSGSDTLFSGAYVQLVPKAIVSPVNGTCPSGYTLTNGQCVQNPTATSTFTSIENTIMTYFWEIVIIMIVIILIALAIRYRANIGSGIKKGTAMAKKGIEWLKNKKKESEEE